MLAQNKKNITCSTTKKNVKIFDFNILCIVLHLNSQFDLMFSSIRLRFQRFGTFN